MVAFISKKYHNNYGVIMIITENHEYILHKKSMDNFHNKCVHHALN